MGTIIGRYHTPVNETTGTRDVIHPETEIDAILDPVTGVNLPDRLRNIEAQLIPVTSERQGFITPTMLAQFNRIITNEIIVSSVKPTFADGGFWLKEYEPPAVE